MHEHIDLPDIAELLVQPMFYKSMRMCCAPRGTDLQRFILAQAPLLNNRRYVKALCPVLPIGNLPRVQHEASNPQGSNGTASLTIR